MGCRGRIKLLVGFVLAVVVVRGSIADLTRITGRSMQPTLVRGDFVYLDKLAYGLSLPFLDRTVYTWAMPRRGDIVVLFAPADGRTLVKRVVGLPGDSIEGRIVPQGMVFVLGDNRDVSCDSRHFGCVPLKRIVGRVETVAFSLDPARWHLPRGDRWLRALRGRD